MPTDLLKTASASWRSVRAYAVAHKVIATIIALVVLYGIYYMYGVFTAPSTATRYVTTTIATGTVVATMTETGQVSASRTLILSPKASGEVIYIGAKVGDKVSAGQIVAEIDLTDAQQSLRDAQLSLQTAELTYEKNTAASTPLTLLQANNAVINGQTALDKAHDSAYASIASIYIDLSSVINGLDSALHDYNVPGHQTQQNIDAYANIVSADNTIIIYNNSATASYSAAVAAYDSASIAYNATPRSATNDQLVALAQTTYKVAQAVADATKNASDFYDRVNTDYSLYNIKPSAELATLIASVSGYNSTVIADLSNALSVKTSIISAEQSLAEAQDSLQTAQAGPDDLALRSAELTLKKAQEAVQTAQDTLENYIVRAPIAGTIAAVGVQKYDQAGSGTAVATLFTDEENVKVSVNEVDASKLKVGEKATLTFDALPDITIAGTVITVDAIGTVSQGVVSYGAIITFDTPNASVKPGMSATADIVVGIETGLVVPSSAIKTSNGQNYVEIFNPPLPAEAVAQAGANGITSATAPTRVTVTTGLTDDTDIIIESGISAGAQVVTKTITGTAAVTTTTSAVRSTSIFGGAPGGASAGGAVRALTR